MYTAQAHHTSVFPFAQVDNIQALYPVQVDNTQAVHPVSVHSYPAWVYIIPAQHPHSLPVLMPDCFGFGLATEYRMHGKKLTHHVKMFRISYKT